MIDEKTGVEIPERMAKLPRNKVGYTIPWFVDYIEGEPDFRVMDGRKLVEAIRFKKCWLCGGPLGRYGTFAIGPMCAVNKISSEPPSHLDCATFAAKACPFLTRPKMVRRETGIPKEATSAGHMIARNPGVTLLWVSRHWEPWKVPEDQGGGILIDIGAPANVYWYAQGREATHDEVMESIESGYPLLMELAEKQGTEAVEQLEKQRKEALLLVPA